MTRIRLCPAIRLPPSFKSRSTMTALRCSGCGSFESSDLVAMKQLERLEYMPRTPTRLNANRVLVPLSGQKTQALALQQSPSRRSVFSETCGSRVGSAARLWVLNAVWYLLLSSEKSQHKIGRLRRLQITRLPALEVLSPSKAARKDYQDHKRAAEHCSE